MLSIGIYAVDVMSVNYSFPSLRIKVLAELNQVNVKEYKYPGGKKMSASYPLYIRAVYPIKVNRRISTFNCQCLLPQLLVFFLLLVWWKQPLNELLIIAACLGHPTLVIFWATRPRIHNWLCLLCQWINLMRSCVVFPRACTLLGRRFRHWKSHDTDDGGVVGCDDFLPETAARHRSRGDETDTRRNEYVRWPYEQPEENGWHGPSRR